MVENAVFWINGLPIKSGMFCMISPKTLMTVTIIDFKKHCKIKFNAYAEAHEKSFHATPRNPAQNPLSSSDQHETSKVTIGYSTFVQDAASNKVPLPLSPS